MAIINASQVTLSVGGSVISHATSASITITQDVRDTTSKSSGGWKANKEGLKSWEMSGDGFVEPDSSNGQGTLFTALKDGTEVACVFTVGDGSGDQEIYTGAVGYVTSVSMDAGVEESATYSVTVTGSGALALT